MAFSAQADRTNRLLLIFSSPPDQVSVELAGCAVVSVDGTHSPEVIRCETVDGSPLAVHVLLQEDLRALPYVATVTGLVDWLGASLAGSAGFQGVEPGGARRNPWDQRLRIDLDFGVMVGGDLALLSGDDWTKEQAIRWIAWLKGELTTDPGWGFAVPFQGPLGTAAIVDMQRRLERGLRALPGTLGASVTVSVQGGDTVLIRAQIRTDQSDVPVELALQRQLGR